MFRYLTLLAIFLLKVFPVNAQIQLYVSTTASDANPGSMRLPFRTPERAVRYAETLKGKDVRMVNHQSIKTTADLEKKIQLSASDTVTVTIMRNQQLKQIIPKI